jgi:hypothetical protein
MSWPVAPFDVYYMNHKTGIPSRDAEVLIPDTVQICDDTNVPDFKKLRAAGVFISNDYLRTKTIEDERPLAMAYKAVRKSDGYIVEDHGGTIRVDDFLSAHGYYNESHLPLHFEGVDDPSVLAVCNRVLLRAYANANKPEALAAVSLAEARKTAKTLKGLLNVGVDLLTHGLHLKKRYLLLKSAGKLTTKASNAWLQYRYGIRPLVYDIMGAIEAYEASLKPARERFTASDSLTEEEEYNQELVHHASWTSNLRKWRLSNLSVRAGVVVESSASQQSLATRLGSKSVLQTGWELVPFSFIVDWFVTTADLFAAYDVPMYHRVLGDWVVIANNTVCTKTITDSSASDDEDFERNCSLSDGGLHRVEHDDVTRLVNVGMPFLPSVNVRLDFQKLIDFAALFRQLRRSYASLRV